MTSSFSGVDHKTLADFYDATCSQVLAALVRRLSGREVMYFLEERLFTPLGCRDERYWLKDPSGCCQGGTGLYLSLRDFHRVGQCLLDGGRGLLPAWYVEGMRQKHIDTSLQANREERYGYGWQCWQTRAGWSMYGMGGQLSVQCPDKNALLSTIADTRLDPDGVQRIYDAFFEEVYPYLGAEDTEPVCFRPEVPALPDEAAFAIPETPVYRFRPGNPLGLRALRLSGDCLIYENGRGPVTLPFGRGKVKEISYPGWPDVPALSSGGWREEGLLRVRCHALPAPCGFDMLLRFTGDTVTVKSVRSTDPVTEGYEGSATGTVSSAAEQEISPQKARGISPGETDVSHASSIGRSQPYILCCLRSHDAESSLAGQAGRRAGQGQTDGKGVSGLILT